MSHKGLTILAAAGLVAAASGAVFAQLQAPTVQPPRPPGTGPLAPLLRNCPDPAVVSIGLSSISSRMDGARRLYSFRVVATIRNSGNQNYRSGANQQIATIYRRPLGGGAAVAIGSGNFASLNAGGQTTVTSAAQSGWSKSDEFPPGFEARIVYDPDIYLDGNSANDDCSSANNVRTITGAQVNASLP
jgi:hypothetical protein